MTNFQSYGYSYLWETCSSISNWHKAEIWCSSLFILWLILTSNGATSSNKPNIILFLADDLGYGDLSTYGHPTQEYGAIDKMAQEGLRFTQWYAPAHMCTPSRAATLTGRLPVRYGMHGALNVNLPSHSSGLPAQEITLPEVLRESGYRTGMVGKWHLGTNEHSFNDGRHLPYNHGFDYVGHILPFTLSYYCNREKENLPPYRSHCYLYKNDTIVQQPIILEELTFTLTQDAKAFIYNSSQGPFFFLFSLPQTHTPMFNDPAYKGKSQRGPYGDQVNEMAWAVGEVMELVKSLGLAENTLALFVSDHGPHQERCLEGGSPGMFKGGKGTFWEGGLRVPALAWWPGKIASGTVSSAVLNTMDLFPTLVHLAGGVLPPNTILDGRDIVDMFTGDSPQPKHGLMYFYCGEHLAAVRYEQYKIHFITFPLFGGIKVHYHCPSGQPIGDMYMEEFCDNLERLDDPWIFNVEEDPEEKYPLPLLKYHNILRKVEQLIAKHKQSLRLDSAIPTRILGFDYCSMSLKPCCNPPYCFCK